MCLHMYILALALPIWIYILEQHWPTRLRSANTLSRPLTCLHTYKNTYIYIYINVSIYIIFNWAPGLHVCLRMFTFCSQASSLFGNCKWLCWHIYGIRIFIAVNMNAFIFLPWYPSLIRPPLRLWLRFIVAYSFPTSQTTRQIFSKKTKQINVFYFNSYFLILYISLCMYVCTYVCNH